MSEKRCLYIRETYYSGGEGSEGAAAICFSKSKKKLLKYIKSKYLFKDSPEVSKFFSDEDLTDLEIMAGPPSYIEMTKKEAIKTLKNCGSPVIINIHGDYVYAKMTITDCDFI